jgi:hypothetical protein
MKTKRLLTVCLLLLTAISALFLSCGKEENPVGEKKNEYPEKNELDTRYAKDWDKPEYRVARTALTSDYLSMEEKEVYYYLNLARLNPPLFAATYATGYEGDNGFVHGYEWDERKQSLIEEMENMTALNLIYPDDEMYGLARCFAYEGGQIGLVGHDRSQTPCASGYSAECCQYGGTKNGLSIVMWLMIDAGENNADLGHRRIMLSGEYDKMGVSIQPHKTYKFNAVLNFKRKGNS